MKKNIILSIIAIFVLGSVQAQQISFRIDSGEIKRDKSSKRTFGIEPLGVDNKYVYYLYQPYNALYDETTIGMAVNHFIAKFDKKTLAEVNKKEIELLYDNRKRQFQGVFQVKKTLYLFSSFQNQQQKKHYLFVQTINKETLLPDDNMKKIGEIDYSGINRYYNTNFHYEFSPDSSRILVYYNVLNKKYENLRFGIYVYSGKMEQVWKAENVVPEISEGVFSYQKFGIDNSGNVYLKGVNFKNLDNYYDAAKFSESGFFSSKDTYYADFPNYLTQLYKFTPDGKRDRIDLEIPGKFIRSLNFVTEKGGRLFCAGIYSDEGKISARGSFAFSVDFGTKKISGLDTRAFGNELIEMGFDESQIKQFRRHIENKDEWDPYEYRLSDIKTNSRGERYFIAEQFLKGTKVENSGRMVVTSTIFNQKDLFVTRIGKDNRITRIDKINKRQYIVTTNQFLSYTFLEQGGKFYFLFKDFIKKETFTKYLEEGNGFIVELDAAGNQKRTAFQSGGKPDKDKLLLLPGTGIQTSKNELIFNTSTISFSDYAIKKLSIK